VHGSQRFKSGHPLTALARQALTGTDFLPPQPAEAKQAVAARGHLFFCLKGMHILPGQVARVKRVCLPLCQRVSAANLRIIEFKKSLSLSGTTNNTG
jgi:hypothetical protein